ncbi:hypothetical protein AWH48_12125 [Domibacillus aminovorans]|uniref:Phage protein n=1 Tax=Domibacillus aminovorans TaxID=29332 RepID=A0A177KIY8_9BACI|nr:hypothetical protein [Domibacillus aminovorans]OAH53097.1 hypothetical protein AWH48_12125 [Domibacillus aminovorans]
MNLSMKEQLKQWKKDHQEVKQERKKEKPPQKKQEKLSERELRSLMGMDMRTLRRGKGGAYKG